MKLLSEFISDNGKRKAKVYVVDGTFYVSADTETGTTYRADFHNEQSAENFAEDWVLQK